MRQELEAFPTEVSVERDHDGDVPASHQLEADLVDEGGAPTECAQVSRRSDGMQFLVDPDDLQHRNHVLEQTPGDAGAETPTSERLRLDQNVVVRDAAPVPEDSGEARDDLLVPGCVAVEEREKRRGVDEGHPREGSAR